MGVILSSRFMIYISITNYFVCFEYYLVMHLFDKMAKNKDFFSAKDT